MYLRIPNTVLLVLLSEPTDNTLAVGVLNWWHNNKLGLLSDYLFKHVDRTINYFNRALIAILTHTSFVFCYMCRE